MRLLIRSWNLFHGRTLPRSGRSHLEQMVRLVSEDEPDLVALQEVPVWALRRLEAWSGMTAVGAVAMRPLAGPLARRLTALDPDRLRSALTGQANALLVGPRLRIAGRQRVLVLNPLSFRRAESRALGLDRRARLAWGTNRRVCQAIPLAAGESELIAANLHATAHPDRRLAQAELRRLAEILQGDQPCIVCGDFNLAPVELPGFEPSGARIDHVLARGLEVEQPPTPWPEERRRVDGLLLSDHAPVEAVLRLPEPSG